MSINDKFHRLAELGAGEFAHLHGALIDHLQGTRDLLCAWSASDPLQDAGLYHAAYGTDGFSESLVSLEQRATIADIIGAEAEEIVYLYCACDRKFFWPQLALETAPEFKDRFTGELVQLSLSQLCHFCELSAANEIELATASPSFVQEHGSALSALFSSMGPYLTSAARTAAERAFGDADVRGKQ